MSQTLSQRLRTLAALILLSCSAADAAVSLSMSTSNPNPVAGSAAFSYVITVSNDAAGVNNLLLTDELPNGARFLVLVDGAPLHACGREVGTLAGRAVTTVEGLAGHPIIAALIAEQAGQCGYCLSGMAVAAAALLAREAAPDRAAIAAALDGQLCRCGAHPRILRAVERAARGMRP